MRRAVSDRHIGRWCLMTLMAVLLPSLTSLPHAAEGPPNPDAEAKFRREWEDVRQQYEREIRARQKQIGKIEAKERRLAPDPQTRAEKITQDAVAETRAALKGGGPGTGLPATAEKAARQTSPPAEMGEAPPEQLDRVRAKWGPGGAERKKLQEASAALAKNIDLIQSHLMVVTEAARAMSTRVQQSGVLEKALQVEIAAKEVGERLSAEWERERAVREREREQREREAGERARGGRLP
jgi:hypothetical protein